MKVFNRILSLALVIVLLLSVNGIAAVVTDNDSSAFVTKAEFEAVKNNVQGQIDAYNNNLDNAIDGAIATYLATVDVGGTSDAMFEKIKLKLNDGSLLGNFKITGDATQTIDMNGKVKLSATGTGTSTAFNLSVINGSTTKTLTGNANGYLSYDGTMIKLGNETTGPTLYSANDSSKFQLF